MNCFILLNTHLSGASLLPLCPYPTSLYSLYGHDKQTISWINREITSTVYWHMTEEKRMLNLACPHSTLLHQIVLFILFVLVCLCCPTFCSILLSAQSFTCWWKMRKENNTTVYNIHEHGRNHVFKGLPCSELCLLSGWDSSTTGDHL